jgi:hypothetical protein
MVSRSVQMMTRKRSKPRLVFYSRPEQLSNRPMLSISRQRRGSHKLLPLAAAASIDRSTFARTAAQQFQLATYSNQARLYLEPRLEL